MTYIICVSLVPLAMDNARPQTREKANIFPKNIPRIAIHSANT